MHPVTVITDHKNLIMPKITKRSLLNPARIRRITDVLNQFDLKFQHIKGTHNYLPDLMSRGPEFEKINNIKAIIQENKLAKLQDKDHEIHGLKTALTKQNFNNNYNAEEISKIQKTSRRFILGEDNILYFSKRHILANSMQTSPNTSNRVKHVRN